MRQKIINVLNILFQINITVFVISAPFSKIAVKIALIGSVFFWTLINILECGSSFYKNLLPRAQVNKQILLFFLVLTMSTIFSLDAYYSHGVLLERYLGYILFFLIG